MTTDGKAMWDVHLGYINVAKYHVEQESEFNVLGIRSRHRSRRARRFEKPETDTLYKMKWIWTSETGQRPWKDCIREGRISPLLCHLEKVERHHYTWYILHLTHVINHLLIRRPITILHTQRKFQRLAVRDWWHRSRQDSFYIAPWSVLFTFSRILLGLCKAPGTFKKSTDVIVSPIKVQFALVYLDDIVIVFLNEDEQISQICTVL